MTDLVLMKDMATVVSSDQYKKMVARCTVSRALRRIEYPTKIVKTSSTISEVTKGVSVKNNTVVILPAKDIDALFIPFLLDSLYIKGFIMDWNASVRKLANLSIVSISDFDKVYLCKLEGMLLTIAKLGENHLGYEYFFTAERLLADLRDAMVFELYHEDFLHEQSIYLTENWKKEIDLLGEKRVSRGFDELVSLIDSMLKPNNVLYDNLKRFMLFVDRFKKQ